MIKKNSFTTTNLVHIAMFAAVLSILSQVSFELPGGIPITLQTFGVVLIGIVLGPKLGVCSVLVYLLMGSVGIPVFASLNGGFAVLTGPTGGYLIGFLPMVLLVGLSNKKSYITNIIYSIAGLLICHIFGLLMFYSITNTWLLPSVPIMLAKDISTSIMAISIGKEISRRLSKVYTYK